jgi:hypothetical protein
MIGAPPQHTPQPRLALNERQRVQILAVKPEQIEGDEAHGQRRSRVTAVTSRLCALDYARGVRSAIIGAWH